MVVVAVHVPSLADRWLFVPGFVADLRALFRRSPATGVMGAFPFRGRLSNALALRVVGSDLVHLYSTVKIRVDPFAGLVRVPSYRQRVLLSARVELDGRGGRVYVPCHPFVSTEREQVDLQFNHVPVLVFRGPVYVPSIFYGLLPGELRVVRASFVVPDGQ